MAQTPMDLTRSGDWLARMEEVLAHHEQQPFARGRSDCWCMCLDVAKAMTGVDPFADQRSYTTARGAIRMIKRFGVETLPDGMATRLPEVPPLVARRGDFAAFDEVMAVGVVVGAMVITKAPCDDGGTGIAARPLAQAARAFRVG